MKTSKGDVVEIRIVIDSNVLVPSLYRRTPILHYILQGVFLLIWNQFIFDEAMELIDDMWPRYRARGGTVAPDIIKEILNQICDPALRVAEMPGKWKSVSPDRDDDPFLWAAFRGRAEFLVTKDRKHLLELGSFRHIPIGNPRDLFRWADDAYPDVI